MFRILVIRTFVLAAVGSVALGGAQGFAQSTSGVCSVQPRTEAELAALNATPAAPVSSPVVEPLPDGEPLDDVTRTAITETLDQVTACAAAGDIARLLALYSDAYVVNVALAQEPVPIEPGGPATPASGSGIAASSVAAMTPRIEQAVLLADGQIVAVVDEGGRLSVVRFVEHAGRWRIDAVAPFASEATPAAERPAPVQAALQQAATDLGLPPDDLEVIAYEPREWPDASLGCPREGEFYAQVITPGYDVTIDAAGQTLVYHTDEAGRAVRCDR